MDKQTRAFSSRLEFEQLLQLCLSRARLQLQMFDPDFALWQLGSSATDAILRPFLSGGGKLQLVAHSNAYLEREAPRFLRLLKDYGHAIECRLTHKNLRQLTDSFCIADGRDQVRRFHAEHLRGEAVFDSPPDTQVCAERFIAIWKESSPGLHASTAGL
ncbi:DUF7931 domain-containing protein [Rugamonas apoptosis]|uniref:DUF7931 domain-containing protein n=1 Tax=Rugamonas apoptosis TaxID=2758570 RepID=A0A7W2F713_9BURK|nr:hypothetical protein [Rugamonas apoptosis]MBA5686288.1 hypothetical protein [Rugamonas apoptosis]